MRRGSFIRSKRCPALSTEIGIARVQGVAGSAPLLDFGAALHAKGGICWILVVALRAAHVPPSLALVPQLIQQRGGILQVAGVEALGEPVVDLRKHRAGLFAAISVAQQSCE